MSIMRAISLIGALLLLGSCGDNETFRAPATQEQGQALCEAACEADNRCGALNDCKTKCQSVHGVGFFHTDYVNALTKCAKTASCAEFPACFAKTVLALEPNWKESADYQLCDAKDVACTELGDDLCEQTMPTLSDAGLHAVRACLAKDCAAAAACISALALNDRIPF
jgi:hypothetical protein